MYKAYICIALILLMVKGILLRFEMKMRNSSLYKVNL